MKEIVCTTQAELDAVPVDFDGRVVVKFGTPYNRAVINRRFKCAVKLYGNASAELSGNASAELSGNASAELYGNASAELSGNASAVLYDNASAVLYDNASAVLYGNASAVLYGNASAELYGNASAVLYGNASAVLYDNASAVLYGNASAVLYGNASAELYGNASAVLYGNASATGSGNAQIVDAARKGNVKISGNARVVYNPLSIDEYIDFYGLESTESTVRLFKAVHFNGKYYADADPYFVYTIGDIAVPTNGFNDDINQTCGAGINLAHKAWALNYGYGWEDLAILELECEKADVLVPLMSGGKVRARKAKVIRDVPLEECGLYGKMLAKQRVKQ